MTLSAGIAACCATTALAAGDPLPEARAQLVVPAPDEPAVLTAFALFQARAAIDDLASTNPLLDGQIVGRLGGTNGVIVDPAVRAVATEQRFTPFVTWSPRILGGAGSVTAAFEIDFAYGDQAYGIGGNTGGGFGADQVNLQTRRLHADWRLDRGGHDLHVVLGLQLLADGVADPTRSTPDGLLRSGGRLAVFGSEAAGLSAFGRVHDAWGTRLRYRLGTFTLVEQGRTLPDDVWLSVADVELRPAYAASIGAHLWYLQDRSGGTGGPAGLSLGPTGALWELQGGPRLDPYDGLPPPADAPIDADIVWTGLDAGYNADLTRGPVGVHAVALANVGRMYAPVVHDDDILGGTATVEGRLRWAAGGGSVLRVAGVVASGDDADPQRYTGVVTGNAYGVAAAPMPTMGTMLLFPDAGAVNRMVSVVADLSAGGAGLLALTGELGYDPVPDKVTVAAGTALAADAGGGALGSELNARVAARPLVGCTVSARGATVWPGPAAPQGGRPWTLALAVDWLLFSP